MIAIITMAIYCALYMLALGAVGMVIEIITTLRVGWSDAEDDECVKN